MAKQGVKKVVAKKVVKKKPVVNDGPGQPPKYATAEELQAKCDEYFKYIKGEFKIIDQTYQDEKGNTKIEKVEVCTRPPESPAITGLALFLGFESRQSVYDYEKNGLFSYTIKRNRLKVEHEYEKALLSRNSTGAIFALKNFGWSDKQEIDHKSTDGSMSPPTPISFTKGST
jgi:DNA-packaging protein gp3